MLWDAAVLALAHVRAAEDLPPPWDDAEATSIGRAAAHLLVRRAECARALGPAAEHLVGGIELVPFLDINGGLGPGWAAHPLASPGWHDARPLREPDATRGLAAFMGPAAGPRGAERILSFLRILIDLAGAAEVGDALTPARRPTVVPEHPVRRPSRRTGASPAGSGRTAAPRIDLLFEWASNAGERRAVVVVEAKLGATVSRNQLRPYREEARRRAQGGVALVLLTARGDRAEDRHPAWRPVRWFPLLRRWEAALVAAGDDDPEFARLRAGLWRFVLSPGKARP